MVRTKLKMNADLKQAFSLLKPVCDVLMVCPSMASLSAYSSRVSELKKEVVQELQQYLLYPLISRIKCNEIRRRIEMHLKILDAVRLVLEKITVNSFEMYMKLETGLLSIIFDSNKPGMISDATEDVKYATLRCLTVLMLNIPYEFRVKLLKNQVPMLAQAVFVCVHIAKLERLRVLRIAAIECVLAHTMTHAKLTVEYRMVDDELELLAVDNMLSSILPGVLAALQDVCACPNNPTHAVVSVAVEAIHRILCIPMHDKYLAKKPITTADFVNMLKQKNNNCDTEVSNKAVVQKSPKDMAKRSEEWFAMAGEKLTLITKSLVSLRVHEHFKVRKELAIFCYRILSECSTTMSNSIPLCLDVLITLSKDEYTEVSGYCVTAVATYFANASDDVKLKTMDSLSDNLMALSNSLPRILNNIDNTRKVAVLNLLHGYLSALCSGRPQRLTAALSAAPHMQALCSALGAAAEHDTRAVRLTRRAHRELSARGATVRTSWSPWSVLARLELGAAMYVRGCCALLGGAECAELALDVLLQDLRARPEPHTIYILNWMISSVESTASMAKRVINAYIEPDVWYLPLEVGSSEAPLTTDDTYDVTVYNPRAWYKDSVPDLYEGTVETRYTDVSYRRPRAAAARDPRRCGSPGAARHNLVLSCLLTEGLAIVADRMQEGYQPYLLKTLCLILERVGSEYELLHLAGLKALQAVSRVCGHASIGELINWNADYFTNQITHSLKKSWNCQSALQILCVVMQYSDSNILDCLYGIVEDVLVQSCDKYYEKDVLAFLQTFLTLVECLRKWFPPHSEPPQTRTTQHIDLLTEVREYVKDTQEAERLLSDSDFDKTKSPEEMFKEHQKRKEDEEELHYDDTVTAEKQPLPRHVTLAMSVVRRSLHLVWCGAEGAGALALRVAERGLPLARAHEDELLPLVHEAWAPLAACWARAGAEPALLRAGAEPALLRAGAEPALLRAGAEPALLRAGAEPALLRAALALLLTLADLSKQFITHRTVKEVLPELYKYLHKAASESYLKDVGSAYRHSAAYSAQLAALGALGALASHLRLTDDALAAAMTCVQAYLSNKQPKPLQEIAVDFFKTMLNYEYAATWYHLRRFCDNDVVLPPPDIPNMELEPVIGTPYQHKHKDYDTNIKLIFDFMVS